MQGHDGLSQVRSSIRSRSRFERSARSVDRVRSAADLRTEIPHLRADVSRCDRPCHEAPLRGSCKRLAFVNGRLTGNVDVASPIRCERVRAQVALGVRREIFGTQKIHERGVSKRAEGRGGSTAGRKRIAKGKMDMGMIIEHCQILVGLVRGQAGGACERVALALTDASRRDGTAGLASQWERVRVWSKPGVYNEDLRNSK